MRRDRSGGRRSSCRFRRDRPDVSSPLAPQAGRGRRSADHQIADMSRTFLFIRFYPHVPMTLIDPLSRASLRDDSSDFKARIVSRETLMWASISDWI